MARRFLLLLSLLLAQTACPSTWGKEGFVQKTFHKNIVQNALANSSCHLTSEEWVQKCGDAVDHSGTCPKNCPLPEEVDEDW